MEQDTRLWLSIALSAVLIPIYHTLVVTGIPVLLPETGLVIGVMVVGAAIVGLILRLSGPRVRLLILTAILFAHLDGTDFYPALSGMIGIHGLDLASYLEVAAKGALLLLVCGAIYAGLWTIRRYVARVVALYFLVFGLAVMVTEPLPELASRPEVTTSRPTASTPVSDPAPPLVIHLLFDALLAPGAIARHIPEGDAVYEAMHRLAEPYGFRVFERAFSRHPNTALSMPSMMNAKYPGQDVGLSLGHRLDLKENAYFDDYAARGYAIRVYQTIHMNFCAHAKVSRCAEFNSRHPTWLFTNESYADAAPGRFPAVTARAFDLLLILLPGPWGNYRYTGRPVARLLLAARSLATGVTRPATFGPRFNPEGFSAWFDRFADEVMGSDRGTLFFAHFMVPHSPYALTSDCKLIAGRKTYGKSDGQYDTGNDRPDDQHENAATRYYAQTRCVFLKIETLLERILRSQRHRDAVIVVQGDHGPRHLGFVFSGNPTARELIDNYATFFAVRAPGRVPAGHDCRLASLPDLFVGYVKHTDGKGVATPGYKTVFVPSPAGSGARAERIMPDFTCFHQQTGR